MLWYSSQCTTHSLDGSQGFFFYVDKLYGKLDYSQSFKMTSRLNAHAYLCYSLAYHFLIINRFGTLVPLC